MRISDWSSDVFSADLLSAAGSYQRAYIHARANNAVLPAPAKLVLGRAIIDGHAILYDEPEVVADVQFGQTPFGTLELNAARAPIHYQGGRSNLRSEECRVGKERDIPVSSRWTSLH